MSKWKGIILAGGLGTRLYPSSKSVSKQLIPVYDKPMIYYPLSTLMLAQIKEVLIITTKQDLKNYKRLLGDGSHLGMRLEYKIQDSPNGIGHAFLIGEKFIKNSNVCLILGDNIFHGQGLYEKLIKATARKMGATIFGYQVNDPERYGIVEFSDNNKILSLEEKPKEPKSNFAITGIYFYDSNVIKYAKETTPSKRGELEITDINIKYLNNGNLNFERFGRGFAWLDTGTHDSLLDASHYIQTIEHRQGLKVACIEEIAYRNNWISKNELIKIANNTGKNDYSQYLIDISREL